MSNDFKEFIKETIKAEIDLLKLFSLFLIGLVSGVSSMLLTESYNKNGLNFTLFILGIIALVLDSFLFTIFVLRIFKHLKQLKNEKL